MSRYRTGCCVPGYCHHQLQIHHWIHIYLWWVSFSTKIHSLTHHGKPTFFVYILLLFAETLCRSSRRPSQSSYLFSSLMHCWYVRLFCLPLCTTGICIFNSMICVSFQCVCSGILIGCGMQKIAALSNLVAYYCIGLPVGIALMFTTQLKILGNDFIWFNRCLFVLDLCEIDLFSPLILEEKDLNIGSRKETS